MTARSRQAQALARTLADRSGVRVAIESTGRGEWLLQWAHGPTDDQMRNLVQAELDSGRYPDMAGQRIQRHRGWAPRAWAARAVAADREGLLRPAVAAGAAQRRQLAPSGVLIRGTEMTAEDFALLAYVERLLEETAAPDMASDPADEPVIERLLAASGGNEYRMTEILLSPEADAWIVRGELPEGVTPLRREAEL